MKLRGKKQLALAILVFVPISLVSSSVTSRPQIEPSSEITTSTTYNNTQVLANKLSFNTTSLRTNNSITFNTNYSTTFSTNYSTTYSTTYSSNYSTTFSSNYSTSYSTNYSTSFTSNYSASFTTNYSTTYTTTATGTSYFTTSRSFTTSNIPVSSTSYNATFATSSSSTNTTFDSNINGTPYSVSYNESYSASYGPVSKTSNDTTTASTNSSTEQTGVWGWIKSRFLGVLENYSIISPSRSSKGATVKVTLKNGVIAGVKELIPGTDRYFYSFKGIPYAEPPVGSLRFKEPIPASPWNGTRNGTLIAPVCPQINLLKITATGSEDCLYLNLYTPRPEKANLPVMVWFHGGIYLIGGANEVSPLPLLAKDIVIVIIQYRLGTLGFLSTEDSVLPGNMGLKDQTLALRWVKDNIEFLGGNPNNVTLFGNSAGASSIHFQILSPKAKGLFDKAILQSGSALSPWAVRKNHRQVAIALGQRYSCFARGEQFDSEKLMQCLQSVPVTDLVSIPYLTQNYKYISLVNVMSPRVDGDFLPKHPATLLKEGNYAKVNIMTGVVKDEGAYIALPIVSNEMVLNEVLDKFESAGPPLVLVDEEENAVDLAHQIFHHYLGGSRISIESARAFVDMISDATMKVDHDETAQLLTGDAMFGYHTYSYELQYKGQYTYLQFQSPATTSNWVNHKDELIYLFDKPFNLQQSNDIAIRDFMVNLWTNFATTGNPTPNDALGVQWLPVTPSCLHYLVIDKVPHMQEYDRAKIVDFWRSLQTELNNLLHTQRGLMSFFHGNKRAATPPQQCGN